jgi:hypothetical protein
MRWMLRRWKLRRQQGRVLKSHDPTDPTIPPDLLKELNRKQSDSLRKIERELDQLTFMDLLGEAHKYDIPIEFAPGTLMSLNTPAYRSNLRKQIDDERTRRREVNAWWWKNVVIPALTALTGLAGVITGMIAVIHAKK